MNWVSNFRACTINPKALHPKPPIYPKPLPAMTSSSKSAIAARIRDSSTGLEQVASSKPKLFSSPLVTRRDS